MTTAPGYGRFSPCLWECEMCYLKTDERWSDILQREGMTTLEVALTYEGRKLLSNKKRGRTWLHTTDQGQDIFIKQDKSSSKRAMLRALIRFQKPRTAVEKEYEKLKIMKKLGFNVPEVILIGATRKMFFMPDKAVMIMLPVPGRSLSRIWKDETDEVARQKARKLALDVLSQLWERGCDWGKDCKPEHFFIDEDGKVSIIDVERMHFRRKALSQKTRDAQLARFNGLL